MNIEFETRCKVCNQKMEYLDHELTVIPEHQEGDLIGVNKKMKAKGTQVFNHPIIAANTPVPIKISASEPYLFQK